MPNGIKWKFILYPASYIFLPTHPDLPTFGKFFISILDFFLVNTRKYETTFPFSFFDQFMKLALLHLIADLGDCSILPLKSILLLFMGPCNIPLYGRTMF